MGNPENLFYYAPDVPGGGESPIEKNHDGFLHPENFFIGKRKSIAKDKTEGWSEDVSENGTYPIEVRYATALLELCQRLPLEGQQLVGKSIFHAMIAHKDQYRGTGEPYITHTLTVAGIAALLGMDAESIAAAVRHDEEEDQRIKDEDVRVQMGDEVANMVASLTKITRRSKSQEDEEYSKQWIEDGMKDPRIMILKLAGDRLHNLRTLGGLKNPARRIAIIQETIETMLPLARVLGLDEVYLPSHPLFNPQSAASDHHLSIVGEMEYLCISQLGDEEKTLADDIIRCLNEEHPPNHPDKINLDAQLELSIKNISPPSMYDVYLRSQGNSEAMRKLCYPVAEASIDVKENYTPGEWGMAVDHYLSYLRWSDDYEVIREPSSQEIERDIREWDREVISATVMEMATKRTFELKLMPSFLQQLNQVPLLPYIQNIQSLRPGKLSRGKPYEKEGKRIDHIRQRFNKLRKRGLRIGPLLGVQESRLPGYIWVTGEDDKSNHESWPVKSGSTIMDYARSVQPVYYSRAQTFEVNGKEVSCEYEVQPGDIIHIGGVNRTRRGLPVIDPRRIFGFRTDLEGSKELGEIMWGRVKRMGERNPSAEYQQYMQDAEEVGREQIRRLVSHPLVVDIFSIQEKLLEINNRYSVVENLGRQVREYASRFSSYVQIQPEEGKSIDFKQFFREFYQAMGFNRFSDEILQEIKEALEQENNSVRVYTVEFGEDRRGQHAQVTQIFADKGISILGSSSHRHDYRGSQVVVFAPRQPINIEGEILSALFDIHHKMGLTDVENSIAVQYYGNMDPSTLPQ